MKKVKKGKLVEEITDMKIIKETPVNYIKLDIEMNPKLQHFLVQYAEQFMKKEEKEDLLIEWAFVNLLKRFTENENDKIIDKRRRPSKSNRSA